jgi:putative oxidoreductase
MDVLILIGRILFVLLFLSSGYGHFAQAGPMSGYAKAKGVPMAKAAVLISGAMMLLGAVSVLLGIWPDLGALLLVLFLIPAAFLMHGFWREKDAQARQMESIQFFKDLSLAGASLMLFGLFTQLGDELGLVLVGPLFG